jgi:hypothetical protein
VPEHKGRHESLDLSSLAVSQEQRREANCNTQISATFVFSSTEPDVNLEAKIVVMNKIRTGEGKDRVSLKYNRQSRYPGVDHI